jgi:large subunit ribosomal protein L2
VFHRGGGCKQKFKFINFNSLQNFFNLNTSNKLNTIILGIIRRFEYDSNRCCFLALVCSEFNELGYLVAQENMFIGQVIGFNNLYLSVPEVGNTTILKNFNLGHIISNISKKPEGFAIYTRAAGAKSLVVKKYINSIVLKLQSDQLKIFNSKCIATLGSISNSENKLKKYTKAGEFR